MKDKQIIEQLHLLQTVKPDAKTLRLIRKRIPAQGIFNKGMNFRKLFSVTQLLPLTAFAGIVIIFLIIMIFLQNIFTSAWISATIALAPNHYEKAKIALENVQNQLSSLKDNNADSNKLNNLSQALALANTEMSGLQLVGEKGKYTSYQCEELYEFYHKDLEQTQNVIISSKNNSGESIIKQAVQYDNQAMSKLKRYNEKRWMDKN